MTAKVKCGESVLLMLIVFSVYGTRQVSSDCVQEGPCRCTSDLGTIDLTPIPGNPAFPDQLDAAGQYRFSYSPCIPFTEGSQACVNVAVCQLAQDRVSSYAAGTVDSATFGTDGSGNTQIKYSQTTDVNRTTVVTLQCNPSGVDVLSVQGETGPSLYTMTLSSPHCCPSKAPEISVTIGLSVGSILCIVLVALIIVYVIAGVAVQKGLRKATGKETIPNYTLWASLPGYIKDGTLFVFRCCGRRQSYQKI